VVSPVDLEVALNRVRYSRCARGPVVYCHASVFAWQTIPVIKGRSAGPLKPPSISWSDDHVAIRDLTSSHDLLTISSSVSSDPAVSRAVSVPPITPQLILTTCIGRGAAGQVYLGTLDGLSE
jgi:hypothetical protein